MMTAHPILADVAGTSPEQVLDVFTEWALQQGLALYPAQEEASLALATGAHVILATPTGSGKSLVAVGAIAQALGRGERSWYTAPIKALVSEKFFDLVALFGAAQVGMLTGDAAVNPTAPIICATAEVLANHALREAEAADVGLVVMDEFHYYADRDRGWAWQVPLLLLSGTQFLLMSATLGDTSFFEKDLTARTGRDTVAVTGAQRPVPLEFDWALTPTHDTIELLLRDHKAPIYIVHATQAGAVERAQALMSLVVASKEQRAAIKDALGHFRFGKGFGVTLKRLILHGVGVHHAGMLPKYRRLVETLAQDGLLPVIAGTDTLGVGINVPIRTVLLTSLVKFDGRKDRMLRSREFHQIAGRAGRPGFDTVGFVVVQAPEHIIDNAKALAKVGHDPKKARKIAKRRPPDGHLSYTEATYAKLVAAPPEPLTSTMRITHAMALTALEFWDGQQARLHTVVLDNHEDAARRDHLVARAEQILNSLLVAEVIAPDDGTTAADWVSSPGEDVAPPSTPSETTPSAEDAQRHLSSPAEAPLGILGEVLTEAGLAPSPQVVANGGYEPLPTVLLPPLASGHPSATRPGTPHTGPEHTSTAHASTAQPGTAPSTDPRPHPGPIEAWLRGIPATPEGPFQIAADLQDGFALNQPLSAFALAALDLLDPESPAYALDVVSVIEATLEDPRPVLMAQQFEARCEAVAAMKADGYDYDERMEALEEVTWPRPLAEELDVALRVYRQRHPWVDPSGLRPKSVVRDLFERGMTFGEFIGHYKLARAEGVVLRYLTDAYRALRSTVPASASTDEVEDLTLWLGELVRGTDSSLLDEWEALVNPDPDEDRADVRPATARTLSANPRGLRVMARQAMFRRVDLLARRAYAELASLDDGLSEPDWREAADAYFAEYGEVGTGPDARGPAFFAVDEGDGEWILTQILDDPEGDRDWRLTARLDVAATDDAGEAVVTCLALAPA
ncbi:MAG: DEAD/DEAH box helicase [Nostocoides sp.]